MAFSWLAGVAGRDQLRDARLACLAGDPSFVGLLGNSTAPSQTLSLQSLFCGERQSVDGKVLNGQENGYLRRFLVLWKAL